MNNTKIVFFIFLMLQSCRFDAAKNHEINSENDANKVNSKLTLSQMQTCNGPLIASVEKRVLRQIKQRDFGQLLEEADTSLQKKINASDVAAYFKMIDNFYGNVLVIKSYGTATTADFKTLDYIANFSSGDSLELSYTLRFYNDNVKLSYITFNRFKNDPIPVSVLKEVQPKIENIFKKNFQLVYQDCTTKFKANISMNEIAALLEKNLKNNDSSYELLETKPLIFGKGELGFLAKTQKVIRDGTVKKINIIFLIDEHNNCKIADIQFNK